MFHMRANIVAMGVIGAALLLPELAQAEQVGHASWYALRSRTASGEMMNPSAMTAAHRSLPFGTKVVVENLNNGKSVVVRINDRGPFIKGRIIDVSKAAASSLGMLGSGTARVRVSTGGGSATVAAKAESAVKVASATTKMESIADDTFRQDRERAGGDIRQDGRHACHQAHQGRKRFQEGCQGRKRVPRQVHQDCKGIQQVREDRDCFRRQKLGQEREAQCRRPDEVDAGPEARRLSRLIAQELRRRLAHQRA